MTIGESLGPQQGEVVRMRKDRGFGFIRNIATGIEFFFHAKDCRNVEFAGVEPGDKVTFEARKGDKGWNATDVHIQQ